VVLEEGVVVQVKEGKVWIHPDRSERCEGCAAEFCTMDSEGELILEAKDPLGVEVGERIRVAIQQKNLLWYSFLIYGFPLLSFIGGIIGGTWIGTVLGLEGGRDALAVFLGFGLTALSFSWVRKYIQHHDQVQSYLPVVVEILYVEIK